MGNYKSATNPSTRRLVEQTIQEEIAEGNYKITTTKPTVVSALGAIPKPNSTEIRLIHDCSRPHGQAVNDYITTKAFKFQTLDDAIRLLKPRYYMAKIDLKHAYRSVPIHKDNYQATGCKWKFKRDNHYTYFYDTRLPFGASSSPEIFHRLTQSVRRMMARRGFPDVVVYLDDFLVIGENKQRCYEAFETLVALLEDLGFTISQHKLVRPTQRLTFLGVELDTTNCTMSLPSGKLDELLHLVTEFQSRKRATRKQLQCLAGKLNWACRVIYGGRTFLRRILDTINALSNTGKIRLDSEFRADISWWANFLKIFNGTKHFLNTLPTVDVVTDACPVAAGGYFRGDWFYHHFQADSPAWAELHINHKETLAITLAARRWCTRWANHRIVIRCDNQAAVQIINKGTTANPSIMTELRHLFWLSALYNFHITAIYLEGEKNHLADTISRLHEPPHLKRFYTLLCQSHPQTSVDAMPLISHMSANGSQILYSRCSRPGTG